MEGVKKLTKEQEEVLKEYKQAVWDYLIEHSDLQKSGALFVKFHTTDKGKFFRGINARFTHKYHRGDYKAREDEQERLRKEFEWKKAVKEARYQLGKEMRRNIWVKLSVYLSTGRLATKLYQVYNIYITRLK